MCVGASEEQRSPLARSPVGKPLRGHNPLDGARDGNLELERGRPGRLDRADASRWLARGRLVEAEEYTRDAMAASVEAGRAANYLKDAATLGNSDSATAVYERYLRTPSVFRAPASGGGLTDLCDQGLFSNASQLAPSYKRLGELYEDRGDRTKARHYYSLFVELWKDSVRS